MPSPAVTRGARKRPRVERPSPRVRRFVQMLLFFVASVLVANAVVGERGLLDSLDARRTNRRLSAETDSLRQENARLREEARRLREDPHTIEHVAREELGMIKPGELVFLLRDRRPTR